MALVLSGERPAAAATTNPITLLVNWFAKARAGHNQRLALDNLLQLDAHSLDDLGINRGDLFDALHASHTRPTRLLAERRSRRAID